MLKPCHLILIFIRGGVCFQRFGRHLVQPGLGAGLKLQQMLDNIKAAQNTHFTEEELALIDQISLEK